MIDWIAFYALFVITYLPVCFLLTFTAGQHEWFNTARIAHSNVPDYVIKLLFVVFELFAAIGVYFFFHYSSVIDNELVDASIGVLYLLRSCLTFLWVNEFFYFNRLGVACLYALVQFVIVDIGLFGVMTYASCMHVTTNRPSLITGLLLTTTALMVLDLAFQLIYTITHWVWMSHDVRPPEEQEEEPPSSNLNTMPPLQQVPLQQPPQQNLTPFPPTTDYVYSPYFSALQMPSSQPRTPTHPVPRFGGTSLFR
jgi:hypothetical protein